ncbi:MAG: carbohydrate ABC transporter permease [Anaerolineae bacterium]
MSTQAVSAQAQPKASLLPAIGRGLISLLLGVGALLMIAPFYWMVVTSFKPAEEVLVFPPTWWPQQPTWEPYLELTELRGGGFPIFFRNSLFVTVVVTALVLLTSALAGYVFAKFQFRGRNVLFVAVLSMLMIPFNVSIIPLYALMVTFQWTNSYWALIIPSAFSPFGIFLMNQFMHSIPSDLVDAGRIDGASEYSIFFRIVLPLSAAPLGALGIFTFMWTWDDFLWPLVIIDEPRFYTLPLGLSQLRGRFGSNVAAMAAGATVAVLPVIIVYLFAQRRFVEGIALTGIKG